MFWKLQGIMEGQSGKNVGGSSKTPPLLRALGSDVSPIHEVANIQHRVSGELCWSLASANRHSTSISMCDWIINAWQMMAILNGTLNSTSIKYKQCVSMGEQLLFLQLPLAAGSF